MSGSPSYFYDHTDASDPVGARGPVLFTCGLLQVGVIALIDSLTGPELSCSIFYLLPVAYGAWYGGFSLGTLLALAGSIAWHLVDQSEHPSTGPILRVWNGIVHFAMLALLCSLIARLRAGLQRERLLARTDPLTGAANARTFYETAALEAERAQTGRRPLTLAYLDLDDFKRLNDLRGHAAGDEALKFLVKMVRQHVRRGDLLARLGGDEFALLLPGSGADEAIGLLRRLHGLLAREMASRDWPVTFSAGAITFLRPPVDVDVMVRQVDALMYGAKRQGKGRIESAVVDEGEDPSSRRGERRASARVLCGRVARVLQEVVPGSQEELATVRDISSRGVGIHLQAALPADTVLVIESLAVGPQTLLARVVRVEKEGNGWIHGCLFSAPLAAAELESWLSSCQAPRSASLRATAESGR